MKPKELLQLLIKDGWVKVKGKGGHQKLRKGKRTTVIPMHSKDIPIGTLREIMKQTGLQ